MRRGPGVCHQRLHLRDQPQLRHGEGAELQLEADQAVGGRLERAGYCPGALILGDGRRDPAQHAEQERAGADCRVGDGDVGRGEAGRAVEQRPAQRLVDQPHHRGDHFGRRVVGAGPLPQVLS